MLSTSLVVLLGSFFGPSGDYVDHPKVEPFIEQMVQEHQFDAQEVRDVLAQAERKESILKAIARPAERSKAWYEYRNIFIKDSRINAGKKFLQEYKETFDAVEAKYGVPREVIAAIIGVETFYGRNTGSYRVIDALATLAFDYPKRSLFYRELKNYFVMTRDNNLDILDIKGSYAGAMGLGQFIPSSYISYAVDFDGDGKKDLWNSREDAIASVAYYFKRYGWKKDQPVTQMVTLHNTDADQYANETLSLKGDLKTWQKRGVNIPKNISEQKAALFRYETEEGQEYWLAYKNFYVITRYNHSRLYARAVYELSQALEK